MRFSGLSPGVVVEGLDQCEDTVSYFKGNNPNRWCTNIPCFERIVYRNLYPSVDLVCRFNDGNLKYDFIVNPGGSLKDINIICSGIDGIEIDSAGNLVMKTPMGDFLDGKPEGYQEINGQKIDVVAEFILKKKRVDEYTFGFRVANRPNPNYPIIIDPEIIYSSYLGGSMQDSGNAIAVDENGCVYVAGGTNSRDFPVVNGYDPSYNGGEDVFITKISPIPSIVYSTYFGGSNSESASGITVDKMGNIIITGSTFSADFPLVNSFDNQLGGSLDAFVTKFSPSGDIVYSSYLGGSETDIGDSVAVDKDGNAYVVGDTRSPDFPVFNAFQPNIGGSVDGFITKISPLGAIIYSSFLGGNNLDTANSVAADINGNAYVTGETFSINFPLVNAFDNTLNPQGDAFITKISPSGAAIEYSSYLGGSSFDSGFGIAVDRSGNAYVTGLTTSTDFPVKNAFQSMFRGEEDAFVVKIEAVGRRPECILTHKVFDSQKRQECSDIFIPVPDKDWSRYVLTGMKFENGIIDERTLRITPVATSPDNKNVRFRFRVPCLSKFKDYQTGKVIEKSTCLSDIWFKGVLYIPEGREEQKFDIIIETMTKLLEKPQKIHGGYKVKIGLFYVVKSISRVQLEIISNGYCVPLEDCRIPEKDKCCQFLDPRETSFPTLYPRQQ